MSWLKTRYILPEGVKDTLRLTRLLSYPSLIKRSTSYLNRLSQDQVDYLAHVHSRTAFELFSELVSPERLQWIKQDPATRPPGGPGTISWEAIMSKETKKKPST